VKESEKRVRVEGFLEQNEESTKPYTKKKTLNIFEKVSSSSIQIISNKLSESSKKTKKHDIDEHINTTDKVDSATEVPRTSKSPPNKPYRAHDNSEDDEQDKKSALRVRVEGILEQNDEDSTELSDKK
jgi:hypothetical protein